MNRFLTKILLLACLVTFPTMSTWAKKAESETPLKEMLDKYSEIEGVEYIDLKGLLLKFAKPAMKGTPMADMVEYLENICIFHVDKLSSDVSKKFNNDLTSVLSGYIKVTETKEDKILSSVYVKKSDEDTVSELLVYSTGAGINIVTMTGNIPVSELKKMSVSETEK